VLPRGQFLFQDDSPFHDGWYGQARIDVNVVAVQLGNDVSQDIV
jgi:hypothetical protein